MYNVYDLLRFQATCRPDAPFLLLDDATLTYGMVDARVRALVATLRDAGVASADRVALQCPDTASYVVSLFAIWGAQAVAVPLEPALGLEERATLLDIARANWLVEPNSSTATGMTVGALRARDAEPWFNGDRAPAQLLFTSGSSGIPKAVMLSHESLLAAAVECADSIALRADDVQMTTVPFTHAYGQNRGLNATLFAGASIAPVFEDDLGKRVAALKRVQPTVLLSMASFFGFLAFAKLDLGARMRVAVAGAAPLPVPVMERFESRYGIPLLTTYGLTEFLIISCQRLADRRTPGTVGYPSRGVEVRIVDDDRTDVAAGAHGRILVRGCLAMEGYLGLADKKVSADGWLDTEDIGILDADGLKVLGRASSFIKRSGYKVYPSEVQNCLASHPDVVDIAVAKYTSMLGSEELAVEVVLESGSATSVEDLLQYCRDRLPPYKVPAQCTQVTAIARLPSGKPDLVRIGRTAASHA